MIFRTYKDKGRERYARTLREMWNELSYEEQEQIRKNYFGLYLAIMQVTDWNGSI